MHYNCLDMLSFTEIWVWFEFAVAKTCNVVALTDIHAFDCHPIIAIEVFDL